MSPPDGKTERTSSQVTIIIVPVSVCSICQVLKSAVQSGIGRLKMRAGPGNETSSEVLQGVFCVSRQLTIQFLMGILRSDHNGHRSACNV